MYEYFGQAMYVYIKFVNMHDIRTVIIGTELTLAIRIIFSHLYLPVEWEHIFLDRNIIWIQSI